MFSASFLFIPKSLKAEASLNTLLFRLPFVAPYFASHHVTKFVTILFSDVIGIVGLYTPMSSISGSSICVHISASVFMYMSGSYDSKQPLDTSLPESSKYSELIYSLSDE